MRLRLDGVSRDFVPIKVFRAEYDLPLSFGIALFEPKDYAGLGRIDGAGAVLNGVRDVVLNALPTRMDAVDWFVVLPQITALFTSQLHSINDVVRLKDVEIDFAAAGFGDLCRAFAYAILRARAGSNPRPAFVSVYADWLNSTARVSQTMHPYAYREQAWSVQIVTHAYGRAGLIVTTPMQTHYVQDTALGCPAEGFMVTMLKDVTDRMAAATI